MYDMAAREADAAARQISATKDALDGTVRDAINDDCPTSRAVQRSWPPGVKQPYRSAGCGQFQKR